MKQASAFAVLVLALSLAAGCDEGTSGPDCTVAADCDDGDGCTTDDCVDGVCSHTPLECDDQDGCTTDSCADGACAHPPVVCDDGDACTADACDPATGQCTHGTDPACAQCTLAGALACDGTATGDTSANGAALMDAYSCYAATLSGPELVYPFTAGSAGTVRFRLTATPPFFPAILALGGSCDPTQCLGVISPAEGGTPLALDLQAGDTIYLVVDAGAANDAGAFSLTAECGGGPQVETWCQNYVDDEQDGDTDCADADCMAAGTPCEANEATCGDVFDNDGDGLTDCAEADCMAAGEPCMSPEFGPACLDGFDNDGDGRTDCDDPSDCLQWPDCQGGGPEAICDDYEDNDMDGLADCRDPDCMDAAGTPGNPCEPVEVTCDDGFDNDGDWQRDCADADCAGLVGGPAGQLCEPVEASCADDFDNDWDGNQDCMDQDCLGSPECPGCSPAATLACGDTVTANTETDGAAVVSAYFCDGNPFQMDGPELAYELVAPASVTVVATLSPSGFPIPGQEMALMALEGACDPSLCLGMVMPFEQPVSLEVTAQAGVSYFFVLDSMMQGRDFTLDIACLERPFCGDGLDNDGDGAADCVDPDCAGEAGCFCEGAVELVGCGGSATGDMTAGQGARSEYACAIGSWAGREVVYSFTAPVGGPVQAVYLGDSWGKLILLDAGCDPGSDTSCLASSLDSQRAELQFDAVQGETYHIAVEQPGTFDPWPFTLTLVCQGPEQCDDGLDNDFDDDADCADPDCLGQAVGPQGQPCELSEASCGDGFDNDGSGLADCLDWQCDGQPGPGGMLCEYGRERTCDDGLDNNGNGVIDCDDWGCEYEQACFEWECYDGLDDDGDGLTDCADWNCWDWQFARHCEERICDDGLDNDYHPTENPGGETDCADTDCSWTLACTEVDCADGLDADGDGLTDCEDDVCFYEPPCYDTPCDDGLDSDGDGLFDCDDPDCAYDFACYEYDCGDGLDNDNDGLTDCEDMDCHSDPMVCVETICDDGLDNDYDGAIDCADDDCTGQPACVESLCEDGLDNDGDGAIDCADPDCLPAAPCFCGAPLPLQGCGATATGDLTGRPDAVRTYACSNRWLNGPEQVHELVADQAGPVVVRGVAPLPISFALVLLDSTCVVGSADSCLSSTPWSGMFSLPVFWAEPGESYNLVVETESYDPGPFGYGLEVFCPTDTCAAAAAIQCGQIASGSLTTGTSQLGPYCDNLLDGPERIYSFSSPADAEVTVGLMPSPGTGATVALFLGVCDEAACTALQLAYGQPSSLVFHAVAGRTYYLVVDSNTAWGLGDYTLSVGCAPG